MRKILKNNMLKLIYQLMPIILISISCGCAQKTSIHAYFEKPITVKAEIIDYYVGAMHDNYDDGRFATYDATIFKIILPAKYTGEKIAIYHDVPAKTDSVYRQKGLICEFIIDEKALEEGSHNYFIGAIEQSIKVVK